MKKILSLCLALVMMMVPMLGIAEDIQVYESDDGTYSISYPKTYSLLASNTITSLMDLASAQADEETMQLIEQIKPALEATKGLIMLMSADMQANITVVPTPVGSALDAEMLLSFGEVFKPMLEGQLDGIEFVGEDQVTQIGDYNTLQIEYRYEMSGMEFNAAQFYVSVGTDMYIFTLTANETNYAKHMANMHAIIDSITIAE